MIINFTRKYEKMRKNEKYTPMTIASTKELLDRYSIPHMPVLFRERLAMNLDAERLKASPVFFQMQRTPFQLKDNRVVRILDGECKVEVNFIEYRLSPGDVFYVKENSYFEILEISEDAKCEIIAFLPDKYNSSAIINSPKTALIHPNSFENEEISQLIYTTHAMASVEPYRSDIVEPLMVALFNSVLHIASNTAAQPPATTQEYLFRRFIEELNASKGVKHSVSHYAEKLCVTPQYLSKVTTAISGKPVSEWINKAVILEARILLSDPSKTISEISDRLNFPSDSFFCRFFKRETGHTPTQYRKKK